MGSNTEAGVDQVLDGQTGVDEAFDRLQAVALLVATDAGGVVGHLVDHLPVGVREVHVVLEEVGVAVDVGHDQLLVQHRVALEQVGVGRIVVDHHLVDLVQAVLVALAQLLVLHAEAVVRVARREAAVGRQRVHLLVVDHLEDGAEEGQPELAGDTASIFSWASGQLRR